VLALRSLWSDGIRPPERARRTLRRLALLGGLVVGFAAPASAPASSADRAATHAYLQAGYEFTRAVVHNGPQAIAAVHALSGTLVVECPGVLAAAPQDEEAVLGGSHQIGSPPLSARGRGEAQRRRHQLSTLEQELNAAFLAAAFQPDRQAIAAFKAASTRLHWSDPRVAAAVGAGADLLSALFEPRVSGVCADMRSWVASGYRTLSTATREYEAQQEESLSLASRSSGASANALLKRYEGPAERALIRRTRALARREIAGFGDSFSAAAKVGVKLGIKGLAPEVFERGAAVGHGRTLAGGRFVARVPPADAHGGPCRHEVTIEYIPPSQHSLGTAIFTDSGSSRCIAAHSAAPHPSVTCQEGRLSIESTTLLRTRSVRLLLGNGSSTTSPVIVIPAHLGGPARIYYQALRGSSSPPLSLTELDRRGRVLRVVRLPAVHACRKAPSPAPDFRTIVRSATPDGTPFTITGASINLAGHAEFSLSLRANQRDGLLEFAGSASSTGGRGGAQHSAIISEVGLQAGCSSPHQYGIVFAWLKAPGAAVLAQTPGGLVALQARKIPAALHAKGVVVYGAFAALPSELIVRAADGRTLAREDLSGRAREETEFCEGFAET
jgi:hypothetical protein